MAIVAEFLVSGPARFPNLEELLDRFLTVFVEVHLGNERIDEQPAGRDHLIERELFGLIGIEPEAHGDQKQHRGTEQEAAFALQARLAEQAFEGAIGHATASGSVGTAPSTRSPQCLTFGAVMRRAASQANDPNRTAAIAAVFAGSAL